MEVSSSAARILTSRSRPESSLSVMLVFIGNSPQARISVQHDYTCYAGVRQSGSEIRKTINCEALDSGAGHTRCPCILFLRKTPVVFCISRFLQEDFSACT